MKLVCSLFLLMSFTMNAQQIFQKSFYVDTNSLTQGFSMVKKTNGDYIGVGFTGGTLNTDALIISCNSDGNMKWCNSYSKQIYDRFNYINNINDSTFIITGIHYETPQGFQEVYLSPQLLMVNEIGTVLWNKIFIDSTFYQEIWFEKSIYSQNSIYTLGQLGINKNYSNQNLNTDTAKLGLLSKFDLAGNLIWSKTYGTYKTELNDFALTNDSGFIIGGKSQSFDSLNGYSGYLTFIKIDSSGNLMWTFKWNVEGQIYSVLNDSTGYIFGGALSTPMGGSDGFILKIDELGNLVWAYRIGNGSTGNDKVAVMTKLKNGNYAFPLGALGVLIFESSSGTVVSHINASNAFAFGKLLQLQSESNFGLSAIGHTGTKLLVENWDSTFNSCLNYTSIFPISTLGLNLDTLIFAGNNFQFGLIVDSIESNSVQILDSIYCLSGTALQSFENFRLKCFPNPVVSSLFIDLENSPNKKFSVTIYDLLGRVCLVNFFSNKNTVELNVEKLANGAYYAVFDFEEFKITKIFLK